MLSVTKLLGGPSFYGDRLRYSETTGQARSGTNVGTGPVVVWNSTKTCNLECVHCYADAEKSKFVGELTTNEAIALIDDLAAIRCPALLISGGEPLVRPDVLDLAEYAISHGVRVTFSTNGTLINEKIARRLADIGVTYVGISVDGAEEDHDRFRAKVGAYKDALRGIRNCRAAGIRVGVRFTVTAENAKDIDSVFQLVEREGIGRLCIYHLVYSGRGGYLSGIDLGGEGKRQFMNKLISQVETWNAEKREVEVMTVDNHCDGPYTYLWLLERDQSRADEALRLITANGGNRSGMAIAAIDSFGLVHPDQFTQTHTLGSIRERKFSEIWNDARVGLLDGLRNRKEKLKGRCASCRWIDVCNGNFRARAEAATGDYWEADPACYLTEAEIAV